jgi:hypothetical protein
VPELVPLNQRTGHADEKSAVLASNHAWVLLSCYAAADASLCRY